MTTRRRSLRAIAALCDEIGPEDGIDPRHVRRGSSSRKEARRRRTRQLCTQAEEALHLALGSLGDREVDGLRVVGVEPAPDSGHLLVLVEAGASDGEEVGCEALEVGCEALEVGREALEVGREALEALGRAEGVLRAAVASAVHRKRAPDLTFRIVPRRRRAHEAEDADPAVPPTGAGDAE